MIYAFKNCLSLLCLDYPTLIGREIVLDYHTNTREGNLTSSKCNRWRHGKN